MIKEKGYYLLHSRISSIIGVGVLIFFIVSFVNDIVQKRNIDAEIDDMRAHAQYMREHRDQLQSELDYLGSDVFVETAAKKTLGLQKEGERVVIIPDDELRNITSFEREHVIDVEDVTVAEESADNDNMSNYKKWYTYFFTNS